MLVNVRVKPGSSQQKVVETDKNNLVIYIHARAHDGEANKAVIEMLSEYYHVAKTTIKLVRGQTSRDKTFEL